MDRSVVEAVRAQRVGVGGSDRGGLERQLSRVIAERARPGVEIGVSVVVLRVGCQLVWGALGTEVVGVRAYSVVAVVCAGDDDGEELAVGP